MVPSDPGADLVLVQPDVALAHVECLLDTVAAGPDAHQLAQRSSRVRGEVRPALAVPVVVDHQQHLGALGNPFPSWRVDPHLRRAHRDGSLLSITDSEATPGRLRKCRCPVARPRPASATRQPHLGVLDDLKNVLLLLLIQQIAQLGRLAVALVPHHPAVREQLPSAQQQLRRQLPALLESHLFRNVALVVAGLVVRPRLRQVQLAVRQRHRAIRGVREELANLALLLLAQPPAPLALRPHRVRARLLEPAPIEDEHPVRAPHRRGHLPAHLVADSVVVPRASTDEALERSTILSVLGRDRLERSAGQIPQLAFNVRAAVPPLLHASEQPKKRSQERPHPPHRLLHVLARQLRLSSRLHRYPSMVGHQITDDRSVNFTDGTNRHSSTSTSSAPSLQSRSGPSSAASTSQAAASTSKELPSRASVFCGTTSG